MTRLLAVAACALALATTTAHARPHHQRHHIAFRSTDQTVVGSRPAGCPHAFCGCEASLYLFGRIIPELNLAANWIKKFPRSYAAPRMAAARAHHVFVLIRHISGNDWLVHDGNSGRHLTRDHVRSIAGYIIVNPTNRYAMR